MNKGIVFMLIMLLMVGCSSEPAAEDTQALETEQTEEVVVEEEAVDEAEEMVQLETPGEIFAEYTEDFEDLEAVDRDWMVSKYVTLEANPMGVYFENGTIRLVAEETDRVPILSSTPYAIEDAKYITVNAKMKAHFANDKFTGALGLFFTDNPEKMVELNPDSWPANFGRRLVNIEYVNYVYSSSKRIVDKGFVFYTSSAENGSQAQAFEDVEFDQWFMQQFVINLETGEVTCTIDDMTLNGMIDIPEEGYLRIWVHPYGWNTGHEIEIDSLDVYMSK